MPPTSASIGVSLLVAAAALAGSPAPSQRHASVSKDVRIVASHVPEAQREFERALAPARDDNGQARDYPNERCRPRAVGADGRHPGTHGAVGVYPTLRAHRKRRPCTNSSRTRGRTRTW